MAKTRLDIRQSETRVLQDQIDSAAVTAMDSVLASINSELTNPARLIAASTPSLVVTVGSGTVVNPNTSKNRVLPFINNVPVTFAGGTITFPSTSGTITVSPGTNASITIGASQFIAVLVQLDSTGNMSLIVGAAAGSLGAVVVPSGATSSLSLGYIIVQSNVSSVIQNVTNAMIYQFGTGGGAGGSGSGGGAGADLDSLLFQASFIDDFTENATSAVTAVDGSASHTNGSYSANGGHKPSGGGYYQLSYDASKTVTGTTVNMTLSGTPSFTVIAGDMLIVGTEARKIVTVNTQTSYVLESAFVVTPSPSAAAATVSQAVHTKDIYNLSLGDNALSVAFPATTFSEILVDYEDSPTTVSDLDLVAGVGYTASPDGTNYTLVSLRPTLEASTLNSTILPSAGSALYLRFFANKSSGSGTINLLRYVACMQKAVPAGGIGGTGAYGVLNSAYAFTNGVGTPVNCSVSLVGGKTTITLIGFQYAVGVNSGSPYGSLDVYINGQLIPRFINGTLTPDGSYLETSGSVITLDKDYSAQNLSVEVLQRTATIDTSSPNITNISSLQEVQNQGFQNFVNTGNFLVATATTGTPAVGTFYSTISGRAPLVDLTQDLKARMGIERLMTQSNLYRLLTEFGPNGESVWTTPNDIIGQIRFVGDWVPFSPNSDGQYVASNGSTGDYAEITFYGTGLNVLVYVDSSTRSFVASTDGGAEGANLLTTGYSSALTTRSYSPNQVIEVISGLTLGIHTVKIRNTNSNSFGFFGVEVLNESSNIKVNPGISYVNGQKLVNSSQSSISYSSAVTGTKGGRVLVYQKSDGTIAQAFQATNASQLNMGSADHTNEEVVRVYEPREFGAYRSDDFSTLAGSNANAAFYLDDGTTGLQAITSRLYNGGVTTFADGLGPYTTNAYWMLTFVGTGLDIIIGLNQTTGATSDTYTINVDGTNISTTFSLTQSTPAGAQIQQKIVSGLPYGTHTVKFTRNAAVNPTIHTYKFVAYQPKKPSLPSGAFEVGDYNVLANYAAPVVSAGFEWPGNGVLRKTTSREVVPVGTWSAYTFDGTVGPSLTTSTATSYLEYVFFGTGISTIFSLSATGVNYSFTIDGVSNLASLGASTSYVSNNTGTVTFNSATGVLSGTATGTPDANAATITGLPLGLHKLRVTFTSAGSPTFDCFDIITPIHSPKSNLYFDLQNSLPVGSGAIGDNRLITPVKQPQVTNKYRGLALYDFTDLGQVSTSSTSFIPMPQMYLTVNAQQSGWYFVAHNNTTRANATGGSWFAIFVDGVETGTDVQFNGLNSSNQYFPAALSSIVYLTKGVHNVSIYWKQDAGNTLTMVKGNLNVIEL